MNIQEAKEDIKHTVQAYLDKDEYGEYIIPSLRQRPILLIGPPGIGKTQIMQQIAAECGIGLVSYTITHHTRQSAVGLPYIKEVTYDGRPRSVTEYTMSEIIASIYQYMEETGRLEGILFIDEINCVSETLAPTMLQFLQCKTFGNQEVPRGWIIAAAGNPPEYNRSVREFDFVTLDRVRKMNIEADLEVFKGYARARHLHPFILSYLELRPRNFYRTENDVDGLQFVTARGWEDLSFLISSYEKLGIPVTEHVIGQYLQHTDTARDVAAYYDLYQKYRDDYDISNILKGRVSTGIYQRLMTASFDERLSCVELLVSGLHNDLAQAMETDRLTDACYEFLKNYQKRLKTLTIPEPTENGLWATALSEQEEALARDEKTGLLSPAQTAFRLKLVRYLRDWTPDPG
ncbi:MAG: AAA family ATPase, partial [Eubacterium sp.]|nr:AAA family ATPase [Eubacterium sp.]